MVAIVAGNGLGLFDALLPINAHIAALGQGRVGQAGGRCFVNARTGNLVLQALDESLSGRGLDLPHLRTYNSLGPASDADGDGWRWDGERSVMLQGTIGAAGSIVVRIGSDGHETKYAWNGTRYASPEGDGAHDSLAYVSGPQQWLWTEGTSRRLETYSAATGKLASEENPSGHRIVYQYDESGRLSRMIDSGSGQRMALTYGAVSGGPGLVRLRRVETQALGVDARGRATSTLAGPLKQVEYDYDSLGRLTLVKTDLSPTDAADNAIYTTTYAYDGATQRVASISQSDGFGARFTYDASARVATVVDAGGKKTFTYQAVSLDDGTPGLRTDIVLQVAGSEPQTWRYYSNDTGRLVRMDAPGSIPGEQVPTRFRYDADGNLVEAIDGRGNAVAYEYDDRGNRTRERDALGNTVTRTYDERNQILTETHYGAPDPDGGGDQGAVEPAVTHFVYDPEARLRFTISAEGRVEEFRYGTAGTAIGLLTHGLRFPRSVYTPEGVAGWTEASLKSWSEAQDKSQIQQTEYAYDFRGNLARKTDYSRVDASGIGVLDATTSIVEYIYDGHGALLQTIAVRGSTRTQYQVMASVVRDGLGRERQANDASGVRTTTYGDAERSVRITTAAGLVEARSFDDWGRMVAAVRRDAAASRANRYVYDDSGRLRMTEDAQGSRRFEFYGAAGRLQHQVDAAGAITSFEYDAAGQVTAEIRYRTATNTGGWYDGNTNKVIKNQLTIGADIVVDPANDRVIRYGYDAANRLVTRTDAVGTRTETRYDGMSRVTELKTGVRAAKRFYDRDGRQVGALDPQGFLTEYKFDAAGRLVQTVRYVTRSPGAADLAAPIWKGGLHLTAIAGRPFEHYVPAQDADGDGLSYRLQGTAPAWLTLDTSAGVVLLKGTPPVGQARHTVTVLADDQRGKTSEATIQIAVVDPSGTAIDDGIVSKPAGADPIPLENIVRRPAKAEGGLAQPSADDVLAQWRPANTEGLRSYLYYDGQGRVVGAVDERGFLSETLYDEQANQRRIVHYLNHVSVATTDTLAVLRAKAGNAKLTENTEYDQYDRVGRRIAVDGTIARLQYDEAGRLVREETATGTGEQRGRRVRYSAFGEVTGELGGVGDATLPVNPSQTVIDAAIESHGMRHEYDNLGRRAKTIDANGNPVLYFYDREHRRTHEINAEREVSETVYNRYGQVESVRRYANRMAKARYQELTGGPATQLQGRLPAVDPANDQLSKYEYDRRGLMLKKIDGEGYATAFSYNEQGELAKEIRTIAPGRTTSTGFDYDLRGAQISKYADAGGPYHVVQTAYDAFGRPMRTVDTAGKVAWTAYKDNGRSVEETDALNRTSRTDFDLRGRPLKRIDPAGAQTTYVYDDVGRSVSVTTPEGVQVKTRNTRHGQVLDVKDGRGGVMAYEYNRDGQLTKVTDALGKVVRANTYDRGGRLLETADALGLVTRIGYDAANRVIERNQVTGALNTAYEFNALGQQVKVIEGAGSDSARTTTYLYDREGQLKQVIVDPDGLGLSTRYTYDGLGNAVTVEHGTVDHPNQSVVQYVFDNLGRKAKEIVAPSSILGAGTPHSRDITTEYRYDNAGRIGCIINANGHSTWYVYDAAGQRTHVINAEGEVVLHAYDANGRQVQVRRYVNRLSSEILSRLGDAAYPVVPEASENDARSYTVYDRDGRARFALTASQGQDWIVEESRFDANGNVVESRRYDKALAESRVAEIDGAGSPGISTAAVIAELAAMGYAESEASLKNVRRMRYAYDANNRLRFTVGAQGEVIENAYDSAGNVLARIGFAERPALTEYTEGAIDTAVNRKHPGNRIERFAYDVAGRQRFKIRISRVDRQGVAMRHLVSEQVYDAHGRTVREVDYASEIGSLADYETATLEAAITASAGDRSRVFVYDAGGRQAYRIRILSQGPQGKHLVTRLEYDAMGRLVQSTAYAIAMGLTDFEKSTLDAAVVTHANENDRTTSYVYDAAGRKRFVVDADRSLGEMLYDAMGQVVESRRFDLKVPVGTPRTEAALTELRGLRAVGDSITRGEIYVYDRVGRLLSTTGARKSLESYSYNGVGDRISRTDRNGASWNYRYDRLGRVVAEFSPPVEVVVQMYGGSEPSLQRVALENRSYRDIFGNLIQTVERANSPQARSTDYAYDVLGRLMKTTLHGHYDPATGKVEREPGNGRFRQEIDLAYDFFGGVVCTRTRIGQDAYQYEYKTYDTLGRLIHDLDATRYVTAFAYNAFAEQEQVTRHSIKIDGTPAAGSHWTVEEVAAQIEADVGARTIVTSYDNAGRKVEAKQPAADYYHGDDQLRKNAASVVPIVDHVVTRYEYNAFGDVRCESVKLDAARWQRHWRYFDAMGREIRGIDAINNHTARDYDAFGNLIGVVEYAEPGAQGSSDESSVPQAAQNSNDRITGYAYDPINRLIATERFGLRYTRWDGDAYVEVSNPRDTAAMVQKTMYDRNGNVTAKADGGGATWHYSYNELNQLVKIIEPMRIAAKRAIADPFREQSYVSPVVSFTLNAFGNTVKQTRSPENGAGETLTTLQAIDAAGNVVGTVDAKGNETLRRFDHAGRVTGEMRRVSASLGDWTSNNHTIERRYAYDATGRRTHVLDVYLEGGVATQSGRCNVFNSAGEVVEERLVWGPAGATIDALASAMRAAYTYDRAGHIVATFTAEGRARYYYNLAGKATRQEMLGNDAAGDETASKVLETHYDGLGRAAVQRLPSFDARIDASGIRAVAPFVQQAYDRWGNVIRRTQGGYVLGESGAIANERATTTAYEYNFDNQPVVERQPATTAWKADGTSYSAITRHVIRYDLQGRPVQELDLADNATTPTDEAQLLRMRSRHYDVGSQLLQQIDGTSIVTKYAYDAHGNRIGTRDALGTTRVDAFDRNNNLSWHGILRYSQGNPVPTVCKLRLYQYDQANRRVGEADVMDDAGAIMHWSYTKFDERGLVGAYRNASKAVTTYTYDRFGNKTAERDANGNGQDWSYSANQGDCSVGRLLSSTVAGNRTTAYAYNDFGQLASEMYAGEGGSRAYDYHRNGLLKTAVDLTTVGTQGMAGGVDYWSSTDVMRYDYSPDGKVVKEAFERTGTQEIGLYDEEGNPYEVYSAAIDPIFRAIHIDYDGRGRMRTIQVPAAENPGRGWLDMEYRYDELGNRRNILAKYALPDSPFERVSDKWYLYDREGRMTLVDGELRGSQIGQGLGTIIAYDIVGRRQSVDKYMFGDYDTSYTPETNESVTYTWDEYHLEDYAYDDLNYLATVHRAVAERNRTVQHNNDPVEALPDEQRARLLVEKRSYDVRGGLVSHIREDASTQTPKTITTSVYRGDGQLSVQNIDCPSNQEQNARIGNAYDAAGVLRTYSYRQGADTPEEFTNLYAYEYSLEFGGYKEKRITVESTRSELDDGVTTNSYDRKGRLLSQSTVNPTDYRNRSFMYGIDDRIVSKHELVRSGDSPVKTGKQDYSYAQGRQVAALGSGTMFAVQFSNGYTPVSPSYPGRSAANHVVSAGDTLAHIAQAWFGDSDLWHLIAEANNVSYEAHDPLPTTEVGKSYRIPNVVGNIRNDADTFLPYSAADVIGDGTPWPGMLPLPEPSLVETVLVTAAITAVAVAVTVYTGGVATSALGPVLGAGIGAAAGNAAGQAVGIGLKQQDGFSGRQLLAAGLAGSAAAAAGGALNNPLARVTHGYLSSQAINRVIGLPQSGFADSLAGVGTQLAVAGTLGAAFSRIRTQNFAWGSALEQLAGNAINPRSGWVRSRDWTEITSQAVGAFTSVAATGAAERLGQAVVESWASESRLRRRRELERRHRLSLVQAIFGGDGAGKAPSIDEWIQQSYQLETAGYDVVAGDIPFTRFTSVNGMSSKKVEGRYSSEYLGKYLPTGDGIDLHEIIEIEINNTPDEKARLAGNTNIVSMDEYVRQSLFRLGIPQHVASQAIIGQIRNNYWQIYRPVKAAEYAMQMRGIEVANATVDLGLEYLLKGAGYATGIGTMGVWASVKEYVYSEAGSGLAEMAGLGPEWQIAYGVVAGGFATPSSLPSFKRLAPDNFSFRAESTLDDVAARAGLTGTAASRVTAPADPNIRYSSAADRSHSVSGVVDSPRVKSHPGVSHEATVVVQLNFELYDTMDDAARAALRESNPNSIREIAEWGGSIYRAPNGRFGYTGPVEGGHTHVNLGSTRPSSETGVLVGDYHTHGDYHTIETIKVGGLQKERPVRATLEDMKADLNVFSTEDIWYTWQDAQRFNNPNYTGYLGTPSRKGFSVVTGERINQYTITPFDF